MALQPANLEYNALDSLAANTKWAVLRWEPIAESGEALNVAALYELNGEIAGQILIRSDVLQCMYGTAADSALRMISYALTIAVDVARAEGIAEAVSAPALGNIKFSDLFETQADDVRDLVRQIISESCSLGALPNEPEEEADSQPLEDRDVQRQWTTKIRNVIQLERPELLSFFGGQAIIVDHGQPVKFGFLTPRFAAHFGLLKPNQQRQGMKDARAKLWELALAKQRNTTLNTALVLGAPRRDDILLGDRVLAQVESNLDELNHEANERRLSVRPVHSEQEAAHLLMELA